MSLLNSFELDSFVAFSFSLSNICSDFIRDISSLTHSFLCIFCIRNSSHDASHLVGDHLSLCRVLEWAFLENVESDTQVIAEDFLVVDGVVVLPKHVVLVGVIEQDSDFPIFSLLAKEGASMRGDFLTNEATTCDKKLSVFITMEKGF